MTPGLFEKLKKGPVALPMLAAVMSVLDTVLFHAPFFGYVNAHVESGFNGVFIQLSLALLMLVLNYMMFYLFMWLGRGFGRGLVAFFFVGNAISYYFIRTYDVMIDDSMMGNVFNTNYAEATSYYSHIVIAYVLLMGVLPSVLLFIRKVDYGKVGKFFANIGVSLALVLGIVGANMTNFTWIDRNSTVIGSLLLPWSYVVNAVRFQNQQRERNRQEILLPDARIADDEKAVVVLMIGESARRDHFSLYGYERQTNPLLEATEGLEVYKANSAATYTTGGVKAILDHKPVDELYEILPNYLYRSGVGVVWRATNWGEPPLKMERQAWGWDHYDDILLQGLDSLIISSDKNKMLVVLHTSTSHGPSYNTKYPAQFERFTPVCETVEMSKAPREQLINAYDNTIVYTDYLVHSAIQILKTLPQEWKSSLIYVSDHGESLGENNLFMHGVPLSIAPAEQYQIPFLMWSSDQEQKYKHRELVSQYNVFHSVLHFLNVESPVYDEDMNLYE